jgi:CHAD domain-containing protein
MNTEGRDIRKSWNAVVLKSWKDFSKQWTRVRRRSTSGAVHAMRTASRRLSSSISIEILSTNVSGEKAVDRLERIASHLGPLRDNHVYRKILDGLSASSRARTFSRFLSRRKKKEHRRLAIYLGKRSRRALHRRIENMDRQFRSLSRNWTVGEYRAAFEKMLRHRYEACLHARQDWEREPGNKQFHRMRVELRDLRYEIESIAKALGILRTRSIRTSLRTLRSLQSIMGDVHDAHKLRMELVAWAGSQKLENRASEMSIASVLQKEFELRMEKFRDHCGALEDFLPALPASEH